MKVYAYLAEIQTDSEINNDILKKRYEIDEMKSRADKLTSGSIGKGRREISV